MDSASRCPAARLTIPRRNEEKNQEDVPGVQTSYGCGGGGWVAGGGRGLEVKPGRWSSLNQDRGTEVGEESDAARQGQLSGEKGKEKKGGRWREGIREAGIEGCGRWGRGSHP